MQAHSNLLWQGRARVQGSPVQLLQSAGGAAVLLGAEPQAAQLEVGFKPQPLVGGAVLPERLQRNLVEPLCAHWELWMPSLLCAVFVSICLGEHSGSETEQINRPGR